MATIGKIIQKSIEPELYNSLFTFTCYLLIYTYMTKMKFESINFDELAQFVSDSTADQIESAIGQMNTEQIQATIQQLDKGNDPKWKTKIRAAILGLNKRSQLEKAANQLTIDQLIELLDNTLQVEDKHYWKLSPLLIGIPFEVFFQLLYKATDNHLQVLQHEGVTEPVQHQLTTLAHELANQLDEIEDDIDDMYDDIESLDTESLSRDDVAKIRHEIGLFSNFFERCFLHVNKALAVAWNTNRLDLIESLNKIKDSYQKFNMYGIGSPSNEKETSSGLYRKLEEVLFEVFGNSDDPHDRDALKDDEPATEGLVKFSVWYLRDYWEMGLLPSIKDPKKLDLNLSKNSEIERTRYRENLFQQAQNNLTKIGLSTVRDLKQSSVFSRKTLKEYIESTRDQIH